MSKGDTKSIENWRIEVKDSSSTGLLVSLIKSN
jgi:hypothetical protein